MTLVCSNQNSPKDIYLWEGWNQVAHFSRLLGHLYRMVPRSAPIPSAGKKHPVNGLSVYKKSIANHLGQWSKAKGLHLSWDEPVQDVGIPVSPVAGPPFRLACSKMFITGNYQRWIMLKFSPSLPHLPTANNDSRLMRTNDNGTAVRAESWDEHSSYCSAAATLSCRFRRCAFMAHVSFTLADVEVKLCIIRTGDVQVRSDFILNGAIALETTGLKPLLRTCVPLK